MSFLLGLSDLTWSLQNNLTGWFGLDWTVNLLGSLISRLGGDQHALREFGSSEFLSAKHSGHWGRRRGGVLSPRGDVWTFQHLVWSTSFDFSELRAAHVFVPDERDPARITRLTGYGTVLRVEPLGTLDGKNIDVDTNMDNSPFLLQASGTLTSGLQSWSRMGGPGLPIFPGSLVPHFPAGGLHLDKSGSSLADSDSDRPGGQLVADVAPGGTSFDLVTESSRFAGQVTRGDPFRVEGDPQTYVATVTVPAAGKNVNNISFTPPAARKWKKGADVDFRNRFATPAPQSCSVTELEADASVLRGTIEQQALMRVARTALGLADGDLFYLVDPTGVGRKVEVVRREEGGGATRIRLRGDDVSALGRVSVKVTGIGATPGGEATPVLNRVDVKKLSVPAGSPPYAVGDVLGLTEGAHPAPVNTLTAGVSALEATLELDDDLPKLSSSGTVELLTLVGGEADRDGVLREDGQVLEFRDAPAALPNEGTVLGIIKTEPAATRTAAIVAKKLDDHRVRLDRRVGDRDDAVRVRTLARASDLGKDPRAGGTALTYAPATVATAPAAGSFVLVSAGKRAARRVTGITFDGLVADQSLAVFATPTVTRFPRRQAALDGARSVEPVWVLRGAAIDNRARALALRSFAPMPPVAGSALVLGVPAATALAAGTITVPLAGAAPPALPGVGQLLLATSAGVSALSAVRRMQIDLTLDRPLPPEASAAGLELVPLELAGPEYEAQALDVRLVTVLPAQTGVAGVQIEMPRFAAGELVLVTDAVAAPPVLRSYRVAAVQGTTISLEAGFADLVGPFPKPMTVRRLDADSPGTGSTRLAVNGTIPGADRRKLTFDVWSGSRFAPRANMAVIDGARVFPAVVDTLDELRATIVTERPLADGAVTIDAPLPAFTAWTATVNRDGNDVVMDGAVVAQAGGVADVVVVPYVNSPRVIDGHLSPGTVKVPDRLDDRYDLTRYEALVEHELHHTVQCAEMGPTLLSVLPMWAVELYAESKTGDERAKFVGNWKTYQDIIEATTAGGVLQLTAGSVYGGLLWLIFLIVHGLNGFLAGGGDGPLDSIDPFALDYFPATVPDPARPDTITVGPLGGETLTLAVGDHVRFKKPSENRPLSFFFDVRSVKAVAAGGVLTLSSGDLPLEGNATAVAKVPGGAGTPVDTIDNAVLRGLGLGWMSILFDPYGELDFRVSPERGSFGDVLLRVGRYAFGTKSWGPVIFTGLAFADNLRRQWGFLGSKPHLSRMEKGASYASGDTYYPLGLLRATGGAAGLLKKRQLVVGDVAQAWFVPDGGDRRDDSLVAPSQLAGPGAHVNASIGLMPFLDLPAAPVLARPITRGAEIDPAVAASGTALADTFVLKRPVAWAEPTGAPRMFRPGARGFIPMSPAMERTAGSYVAFCRPGALGPTRYRHRVTVVDNAAGAASAREAFDERGIDLIHDLEVLDVTVRVGGRQVAEGVELGLLPFERARVTVTPNAARRYDATVTRPNDGEIRRIAGDLSLQAARAAPAEPVEISRVYRYVDGRGFDGGGLSTWGMHVPADVHVPVRRFRVKVDTALPARATADPDAAPVAAFKPGQKAFVLVPVRLRPATVAAPNPVVAVAFTAPPPAGIPVPTLTADPGAVDPTADRKLAPMFAFGGRVLTIALPADAPPEAEIRVNVTVEVGPDAANIAPCTASFTVQPHFTLSRHGGGADFNIARGNTITLDCSGGVKAGKATATPAAGITAKPTGTTVEIAVDAAAAAGQVSILVEDHDHPTQKALRTITVT